MKREVSKAEAIKLVNKGFKVKNDTSDGHIEIYKKSKGVYDIKLFTYNAEKSDVVRGNFTIFLKTISQFSDFYVEE